MVCASASGSSDPGRDLQTLDKGNSMRAALAPVGHDPFDDGRALQDRLPVHCFGCGVLNAHGLQIKSRWEGDTFVCAWQPGPEHIGFPGVVYGGTIASVIDCHAIWAALSLHCREAGHDLNSGAPPFAVVTGSLRVDYLKPASVAEALELRARVVEHGPRKAIVACSVYQASVECAAAEVVTVCVRGRG
jgi:acyl-coenzyme A thioesterase PaaI-like protein